MNELYRTNQFIITEFQLNPLVNTITFERTADIDLNKENIYPLVNIDYVNTTDNNVELLFDFTITVLQQRDIEDVLQNDKIFGSNKIDNLSEMLSIVTTFLASIRNNHNDDNIDVVSVTPILPMIYTGKNLLDGQQFTVTLSIANQATC